MLLTKFMLVNFGDFNKIFLLLRLCDIQIFNRLAFIVLEILSAINALDVIFRRFLALIITKTLLNIFQQNQLHFLFRFSFKAFPTEPFAKV